MKQDSTISIQIRMILATATFFVTGGPLCSQDFQKALLEALNRDVSSHYQVPSNYSNGNGYSPYAPPPQGIDQVARNQHAYDVGYRVGQDDFHHHMSKHFTRHSDLYDHSTHDSFGSGYETGFDRARSEASRTTRHTPAKTHSQHVKSSDYPSGYYPYSPTPKDASPQLRNHHAHDIGFRIGQDDFNHGHSKHFTRHEKLFDKDTHDSFKHGYQSGYDKARARANSQQTVEGGAIRASVGQGKVTIKERGTTISTIRTASPNIEKYHFLHGHKQIVVKSRGNHGPATVQLFDVKTGTLRDKILAFAIKDGQPDWARGMQD